jgi:hypothetical protein
MVAPQPSPTLHATRHPSTGIQSNIHRLNLAARHHIPSLLPGTGPSIPTCRPHNTCPQTFVPPAIHPQTRPTHQLSLPVHQLNPSSHLPNREAPLTNRPPRRTKPPTTPTCRQHNTCPQAAASVATQFRATPTHPLNPVTRLLNPHLHPTIRRQRNARPKSAATPSINLTLLSTQHPTLGTTPRARPKLKTPPSTTHSTTQSTRHPTLGATPRAR